MGAGGFAADYTAEEHLRDLKKRAESLERKLEKEGFRQIAKVEHKENKIMFDRYLYGEYVNSYRLKDYELRFVFGYQLGNADIDAVYVYARNRPL